MFMVSPQSAGAYQPKFFYKLGDVRVPVSEPASGKQAKGKRELEATDDQFSSFNFFFLFFDSYFTSLGIG